MSEGGERGGLDAREVRVTHRQRSHRQPWGAGVRIQRSAGVLCHLEKRVFLAGMLLVQGPTVDIFGDVTLNVAIFIGNGNEKRKNSLESDQKMFL